MKALICMFFLGWALTLFAQEDLIVLPEPSEPPFKVGDLPLESGYTIERKEAPDLNFRIVNNRMRLYWIDDNGLIMEPEVSAVSLRFDERSIRDTVRSFHRLKRLPDDTALGSPYILVVPHRYYVTLLITPPGSEEVQSYRFRYLPDMDEVAPAKSE
jgi:predicted amidohydrolase